MARHVAFGLLLLLLVAAPASGQYDQKQSVDAKIAELQEKIESARAQEAVLAEQIETVTGKIQALETEVGDVSTRLAALEEDLALHREKLAKITELFTLQSRRLAFLRRQYATSVERLNKRLIHMYQAEEVGTIEVVLAASSFTDMLDQVDLTRKIGAEDRRIALEVGVAKVHMRDLRDRTAKTRRRVLSITQAIAVRTEQQRLLRDRLLVSQRGLTSARAEKHQDLVSVRADEQHYASEAAALAQVSAQLSSRIQAAQAGPASSVAALVRDSTPSSSGFIWPVSGPVVSPFGWRWGRMHEGIDIAAPSGAAVVASASGAVIYAGWMGGYGNLVVLDHGGGVATAYAHLSGFAVGTGQGVGQGQTVGYIGCTGHCYGYHLHFEVRINGAAVDPLGYL